MDEIVADGLTCNHCGSEDVEVKPHPVHYARADCRSCGRYIKFLPRPRLPMPRFVFDPSRRPTPLRGSEGQVAAGQSIRLDLMARCRARGLEDVMAVLQRVDDATWFLANKGRPPDDLKWPGPDQLDGGGP